MNDLVLADIYVGLLQDNDPWVSVRRGDAAAYLVARYSVVPKQLLSDELFDDAGVITRQSTTLWIDVDDNTLRRAAMTLDAETEREHLRIGARHGFASYNDDITISPPPGLPGVTLSA